MKNSLFLLTLLLNCALQTPLCGQTAIQVTGIVRSPRGPEPGVQVIVNFSNGSYMTSCLTDINGKFKTEKKVTVGQTVQFVINKKEFQPFEKMFKTDKTGNAGEMMLEPKKMAISGFVKDSLTDQPMQGVEVFFYEDSKLIQPRSTNSLGYFDIETDFKYGQKITVRVSKKGYYPKEQTLTITSEGMNRLDDIKLPGLETRGIKVFIHVLDKKNHNPLNDVLVRYYDNRTLTKVGYKTALPNGEVELKIYQSLGSQINFEISKPKYRSLNQSTTIRIDPDSKNEFTFILEKEPNPVICPILFWSGVGIAVEGISMEVSSRLTYKKYEDFKNTDRETDFTKAQNRRRTAIVSGGVAAGAFVAWLICKNQQKQKDKEQERLSRTTGFFLISPTDAPNLTTALGVGYRF